MKKFLCFALSILFLNIFSQKEANIWYFGSKAGVDFNSGSPVALTDGTLTTSEGCASIADKFGNVLFYTDGVKVFNKVHGTMPNGSGLMGNPSSSQSAIIVPKPGSTTIYYIFTVPAGGPDGLRYSEVDMALDGGKGDVTASKNVPLVTPVSEKVTSVLHKNRKDIWVTTVDQASGTFSSFLVTTAGVWASPTVSIAGSFPKDAVGYLKASSNGQYLCQGQSNSDNVDVLKFDNLTGIVTTWFNFPRHYAYGVEFSLDSKILYISCWGESSLYQYDLTLASPAAIIASEVVVGPCAGGAGAIQMGPDKKIYVTKAGASFLSCIPNPNVLGVGCGFLDNLVSLSGKSGTWGLPNFIQSFFSASPFTYTNICRESPTTFFIQDSLSFSGVTWNFGDPASGAANSSPFFGPKHIFTAAGTYSVRAIVTRTCCPNDTLRDVLTIIQKPTFNLGNDTTICLGTNLNLFVANTYTNYLWQNAATTFSNTTTGAGTYWLKVTNECGFTTDTIKVSVIDKPDFVLRNDTSICDGMSLDLNVISTTYTISNYLWSNSSTASSITVNQKGKYWAKASNQCGNASDTVNVTILYKPIVALRSDTLNCDKKDIILSVANTYAYYLWSTGSTASSIITNDEGVFWVKVGNVCGIVGDTVNINSCGIVMPNVITTNGDNVNDIFKIKNLKPGGDLKILNRWGNQIYQSSNYSNDWSPKDVNDGVYYYIFVYPPENKTFTGFVSVFTGK